MILSLIPSVKEGIRKQTKVLILEYMYANMPPMSHTCLLLLSHTHAANTMLLSLQTHTHTDTPLCCPIFPMISCNLAVCEWPGQLGVALMYLCSALQQDHIHKSFTHTHTHTALSDFHLIPLG